jgi:hypothetical protein
MTQRARVHAGGRRRRSKVLRPYQQGQLDALCGAYSIVNAVRVLCPELKGDAAWYLFHHLLQSLPKSGAEAATTASDGIGKRVFAALLKKALAEVATEHNITVTCRRLPKDMRHTAKLGAFFSKLEGTLSPTCVAVLGIEGQICHWTVAVSATQRRIKLFDSSRMTMLRRNDCTVGKTSNRMVLPMNHVFLLERVT